MAGEVGVVERSIGEEFENGVGAERVMVVLILVTSEDAEDPLAGHVEERVFDATGIAGVVEGVGEQFCQIRNDLILQLVRKIVPHAGNHL